jgi:transcriptional regulator with XRE-family HTH domain
VLRRCADASRVSGCGHSSTMDPVRVGLLLRALRHRLGWRQVDVAARSGLSQSVVSRLELGQLGGVTIETLAAVAGTLGARLDVRLQWRGGDGDRLLDADHARLVEEVVRWLQRRGWRAEPEVTFSVYGERGSIDVLARHPLRQAPLVVEVKTAIVDVQETIATHGRKARLAPSIRPSAGAAVDPARARSVPRGVPADRLLVVLGTRLARRRITEHEATFRAAYPIRDPELRAWLVAPGPDRLPVAGLRFVTITRGAGGMTRKRVRRPRSELVPRTDRPPGGTAVARIRAYHSPGG